MKKIKGLLALGLLSALLLTGCAAKKATVVKIGLTGDSKAWDYVKTEAAKENIDIEIVKFTDYPQPNRALSEGEIDMNAFQHVAYLTKDSADNGYDLTAIGNTTINPLRIYSKKYTAIADVPNGAKVLIPDDVTNGGRALKLLEAQGFITVDPSKGYTPTIKDITSNLKNIKIVELGAANIPAGLGDADFGIVNTGYATDNGLYADQALAAEEVDLSAPNNPYINVIVVRTADKDNATYKKIVSLYQTDAVKDIIKTESKGASIPVWD